MIKEDDLEHRASQAEEKDDAIASGVLQSSPNRKYFGTGGTVTRHLLLWGVETRGIVPVPIEQRTDTQFHKIFFIWFTGNFNILSFSTGSLGPTAFGLSTRDSCLVIIFFNLLCCLPPAYFVTWGPKLGLRQMVQARYSFGYYGVIIPCLLNLVNLCGFCILDSILGGQTLASVANGNLSWTVGIVIISLISLFVSFCGYTVLNWYERLAWIPVLVSFVVALGLGGKHLSNTVATEPATAVSVLSFASVIAGYVITYSSISSDFTTYYRPGGGSDWKLGLYSYFGFFLPITTVQCLGAAVASAAPLVPAWEQGSDSGDVGGLLAAMLSPAGNFGKFLTVLLSLSVAGDIAASFYSISLNIQVFIPSLVVVPRYVFSIAATAIVLPLSIVGAHRFYDTLENFLSLIGYWASDFIAIILIEHFVYRRRNTAHRLTMGYDLTQWNQPRLLPTGIPAIVAGVLTFGLVVPCMSQILFIGPIGEKAGDIGFEVAFFLCCILYLVLRGVEVRWRGRI
ncbi:NCS cytosine-purine permease [Dendrothele bispora CBS 962.96]|uniref:NCS cytosine-purine permease n=1 Tax=Dendrothele bispora (strain CBS 962.96) TaxID=1314807 RepID=A0A4S8KKJ9_DENBC|nr:NCS cytosine-purine permease [Dendrothele bispora CBS 962.96]